MLATEEDFGRVVDIINAAYSVETGDTGIAFKCRERLPTDAAKEEIRDAIREHRVLVNRDRDSGDIISCAVVKEELDDEGKPVLYMGPLGVDPAMQGRGAGRQLIEAIEADARRRGCEKVRGVIVDVREDLYGFYGRMGYEFGKAEPAMIPPESLTREVNFVHIWKHI